MTRRRVIKGVDHKGWRPGQGLPRNIYRGIPHEITNKGSFNGNFGPRSQQQINRQQMTNRSKRIKVTLPKIQI